MSPHLRNVRLRPARIVGVLSAALVFGTAACVPPHAGPPLRPIDIQLQAALNQLVSLPDGPPGIIVSIGNGPHLTLRTAGVANVVTKAKPAANDHMRLASVAKAFSGATALSLVAEGKLSLNDTIGKWLSGLPPAWSHVTLRNLLGHTSGISDFSKSGDFVEALLKSLQKPLPHKALLSFAQKELLFTPGTKYDYSNSDNILAALMVEAASHRSYESVLARNVLGPLHLTQTSLPNGSAIPAPYLHGYGIAPPKAPEDVSTQFAAGWTWASGGVVSTPTDAVHFIQGYVRGATTNKATRAAQFTFRPGNSEPTGPGTNSAGLAIFRYQTSCGTVYGHTGNTSGYTQFIAATADGKRAVAVSINSQITPTVHSDRFPLLRHIYELAVCAAK